MKKLALIATVAALALPAAADAAQNQNKNWYDGTTKVKIKTSDSVDYKVMSLIPAENETRTMDLENGNKLHLNGEAAYLVTANGSKFFAPDGDYNTTSGITYFTEDGAVLYAQPMDTSVYVIEADVQDENNNGYADDIDIDVDSYND